MKPEQIDYNAKLDDTANAISVDDRELVRACLDSVFDETNDCADVWLLQAWACESLEGAETALQRALEIEPSNEVAVAGLSWIHGIQNFAEHQLEKKRLVAEAERVRVEEEARLKAEREAARIKEEEERARAAEAERVRAEEEARLKAEREAARIKEEEERARAAEAERVRAEEEARLEEERAEQFKAEEESARAQEAERIRAEEETRLNAEEEVRRQELEARREAELELEMEVAEQADESCDAIEQDIKDLVDTFATEVRQQVEVTEAETAQAKTAEVESAEAETSNPTENADASGKPVILAVDDSPTIRKLISLALTQHGFEVVTAEDGIQALSIIAERLPDLILSDINMPKLGGYQLCKFVKKHDRTKDIPVIMLSGKDGVFDKMRGKLSGCNAFIGKPFESKELVEIVRANLNAVRS